MTTQPVPTSQPELPNDSLLKSKTFWTGLSQVIGGVAYGWTTKDWGSAIFVVLTGLAFIFQRRATAKQYQAVKSLLDMFNKKGS